MQTNIYDGAFLWIYLAAYHFPNKSSICSTGFYIGLWRYWNFQSETRSEPSRLLQRVAFLVLYYFQKYYGFVKKSNSSEKNVIVEKELHCIGTDDIGNLEDSPRFVFIDDECGNLIVANDGGERGETFRSLLVARYFLLVSRYFLLVAGRIFFFE